MRRADSLVQLHAMVAALAHQLGTGEIALSQWRSLYALLWLAERSAQAEQLAAFAERPSGYFLAALSQPHEHGAAPLERTALAAPLRASLVAFYRRPQAGWQPPVELPRLSLPEPWPPAWLDKLLALQPQLPALLQAAETTRQPLLGLLAELDLYCSGAVAHAPSAEQQRLVEQWLANSPCAGQRAPVLVAGRGQQSARAALAAQCRLELPALLQPLQGECADQLPVVKAAALVALLRLLPEVVAALTFAPADLLNYLEQAVTLEPRQRRAAVLWLAELDLLLGEHAVAGAALPASAGAAQLAAAQRQLCEQLAVTVVGIERLLDHHQLQAIDSDLCRQLQLQFEQLSAALQLLPLALFSGACRQLAGQLGERRAAVDQRINKTELAVIARLLAALELMLARTVNAAQAPLSPLSSEQINRRIAAIAARGWQSGVVDE